MQKTLNEQLLIAMRISTMAMITVIHACLHKLASAEQQLGYKDSHGSGSPLLLGNICT